MKRYLLFFIVLASSAIATLAQETLNINNALNGSFRNSKNAVETIVTGKQIKRYGLSLYHSLSVTDTESIDFLEELVKKDSSAAINKEVSVYNGKINYGFFEFKPIRGNNKRFLFFFSNNKKGMLIYMEGNTSIEEIKNIIKK